MKHSTTKRRPKVDLARRMRSHADIQRHVSIFQTRAWFERAQAIKIRTMSKKKKQEIVDTIVRKVGISDVLKRARAARKNGK